MEQEFEYLNTAEIDAKLKRDILEHKRKIKKICIIVAILLLFIFRDWVVYNIKFSIAIPSGVDRTPINVKEEPIQRNYDSETSIRKKFVYKSLINNEKITIIPQAYYKLSGLVVAYNNFFIIKTKFFDSAALYDLGLAWGLLGDKNFYDKYFKSYSAKTELTGSRVLWTSYKTHHRPVSEEYLISHFSHSHIVPANRNIMAALLSIRVWQKVEIEGELVDMEKMNDRGYMMQYRTSMSRTDSGFDGGRGNGACETIYVTKVKIDNKVYK